MENILDSYKNFSGVEKLGCTLQISGVEFNFESYIHEMNFSKEEVLTSGSLQITDEIRAQVSADDEFGEDSLRLLNQQVLLLKVSTMTDIMLQIKDAIQFLQKYKDDLKKTQFYPGVEMVIMTFTSERNENYSKFRDFPDDFHKLIAECGVMTVGVG